MKVFSTLKQWLGGAADVLMPRTCSACRKALGDDERYLCRRCLEELPVTRFETVRFNEMEKLLMGGVRIERATSYFYYERGSKYAGVLHDIKYHNMPRLGQWLAERAAREIQSSGFFDGVEAVVPVPLHRDKLAKRGYNQSLYLARGIAEATRLAVVEALVATRDHSTQTHKSADERARNIAGVFDVPPRLAAQVQGLHVLIVDDVMTTGATLRECAHRLMDAGVAAISVFTLAAARLQ